MSIGNSDYAQNIRDTSKCLCVKWKQHLLVMYEYIARLCYAPLNNLFVTLLCSCFVTQRWVMMCNKQGDNDGASNNKYMGKEMCRDYRVVNNAAPVGGHHII